MERTLVRLAVAVACALVGYAVLAEVGTGPRRVSACGVAGPYDFDTYEVEAYVQGYARAIELAVAGRAITSTTTVNGELIDVRYQGLKSGPRSARLAESTSFSIPPSIFKSIVWVESNWANGSTAVPYGGVGPVLRSFDCGYGLGQITSGMANATGNATARQAAIGTHYLYNLAEGVRILADKWNSAPRFRPIAGTGNPNAVEDWYFAIWSYNGFAFSNHPLNPDLDPLRGGSVSPIYHCYDTTAPSYQAVGGVPKFGYGDYTYPERVYGCMKYPPRVRPPGGEPVRLFPSQEVSMPDFTVEAVAKAFDVKNFTECQAAGFNTGCPAMDFPTTIDLPERKIVTHTDPTPPANPGLAASLLGNPSLVVEGPTSATMVVRPDGSVTTVGLSVRNAGTGIGAFRVRTSAPWIVVRHPTDAASRTLDGGVAIGSEMDVVLQTPTNGRPRIAQKGYVSSLVVGVNASLVPVGTNVGTVWIEPLLGSGSAHALTITITKGEEEDPLKFRQVAPGLTKLGR